MSPRRIAKSKRGVGKAAYSEKQQEEWFGFLFYRCLIATSWCFIHLFGISFQRLCQGQCYYSVFYIEFQYVVRCVSAATFLISVFCWFQVSLYFSIQSSKCTVWKQSIIWASVILLFRPVRLSSEISSSAKHCPCQEYISVVKFTPEFQTTVVIWRISHL